MPRHYIALPEIYLPILGISTNAAEPAPESHEPAPQPSAAPVIDAVAHARLVTALEHAAETFERATWSPDQRKIARSFGW